MQKDKLLRISQVANRMNCTPRQVYYLIESGHIKALAIGMNGKGLRVFESDLKKFISNRANIHEINNGFCE